MSNSTAAAYALTTSPRFVSTADVVVVGAGLSGLQAATDIQKAGYTCAVVEAKDRVGGKTFSVPVEHSNGVLDLGAAWINDRTHHKMYSLFQKFGLEPIVQRMKGQEVFRMGSKDPVFKTQWPGLPAVGTGQQDMFLKVAKAMDNDSAGIDLQDASANGHVKDVSLGSYFRRLGATEGFALEFWTAWIHDLTGTDPDDIGLVYWLDFVKSCGGIESLLSDGPDGAQYMTNRHGKCLLLSFCWFETRGNAQGLTKHHDQETKQFQSVSPKTWHPVPYI